MSPVLGVYPVVHALHTVSQVRVCGERAKEKCLMLLIPQVSVDGSSDIKKKPEVHLKQSSLNDFSVFLSFFSAK